MCDTKVFWKTQARVWHCRNDSTFLAHFPPTIIWKPCEITFKEDLHMGHLFPSFLPTENSNLLFYFYYKTGLQKKQKTKKTSKEKQSLLENTVARHPAWASQPSLRESHSRPLPRLRMATASICFYHHLQHRQQQQVQHHRNPNGTASGMCMFSGVRV